MFILKFALRNIARNIGRNILLAAIAAAVIAVCTAGALTVSAANKAVAAYKKQFDAIVTISPNIDKLIKIGKGDAVPENPSVAAVIGIQPSQYTAFARSDYLTGSSVTAAVPVTGPGIKAAGTGGQTDGGTAQSQSGAGYTMPAPVTALTLIGDSDTANLEGFGDGQLKIVQGRMYRSGNECIVSADLALLNRLSVGSSIALQSEAAPSQAYGLTVVGVYSVAAGSNAGVAAQASPNRNNNEILTNFETVVGNGSTGAAIQAVYYLKDPGMLGAFQNELRAKGLPDAYQAAVDDADYNDAAGPVIGVRNLALFIMVAALALGMAAAALISAVSARKRDREIGALRAMGMGKRRLALSLACEAIAVAAIGLVIGLAAGALSAKPLSGLLLDVSAATVQKAQLTSISSGSGAGIELITRDQRIGGTWKSALPGVKPASDIEVGRGPLGAWWEAALAALAAACASGAANVLRAARFDPMRAYRGETRREGKDDESA